MDFSVPAQRLGLEIEEYIDLIELFLETSETDISGMEKAAVVSDYAALAERSHSLKGSSGNLGLNEIYEKAKQIEANARNNSLEGLDNLLLHIKQQVVAITDSVKAQA
ncbi:MAG: Hpt domain-containing protein [Deltaproteobacteria bacterium]|jgi:HPt (histidine-containing phosphotransfer) domain-containing protein|nr:Hpt domain-containing protein [Deltaproteobacteria bacterium]